MRTVTRRALIFGVVAAFMIYLGWDLFAGITGGGDQVFEPPTESSVATEEPAATALPAETTPPSLPAVRHATYAVDVDEVAGLAPSAPAGTLLDLWVTWDRPITDAPRLQRLLRGVILEQIAAPVTPEGPYVAILAVTKRDIDKLLWADRFGALSATTVAPS